MNSFFARSPRKVATELVGKDLQFGSKQGTILRVLPQSAADNANWIDRRPLFGPRPVDAYAAAYRGHCMLFLRTGANNTCVRIDSISLRGKVFSNPGQVCRALGIKGELTGKVSFNGRTVSII